MDKIQQKKYLASAKEGIPSTLRILAIDLPNLRDDGFTGNCRMSHDKIFPDEVAAVKEVAYTTTIDRDDDNDKEGSIKPNKKQPSKLKIPQKVVVSALIQCSSPESQQQYGVEMLEASIADLNRYKLRKAQKLGSYSYDPGKYYDDPKAKESSDNADADEMDDSDFVNQHVERTTLQNEMEAPWNQAAWKEELTLRINGQVHFDAPMEAASGFQHLLWGRAYKTTVPLVRSFWDRFLPSFATSDPNGVDGKTRESVRACHKPHAVIANGAALQLVPSALRQLQKLCKKADVPLFVVHDPRKWGGNTHRTLDEALKDLRSEVKNRVIANALRQQGSSAFTRGRMLGQAETEVKWQARDKSKRTKEFLGIDGGRRRRSERNQDWSQHDVVALQKKLAERKVIQIERTGTNEHGEAAEKKTYSPGMIDLSRQCMEDCIADERLGDNQRMEVVGEAAAERNGALPSSQSTVNA